MAKKVPTVPAPTLKQAVKYVGQAIRERASGSVPRAAREVQGRSRHIDEVVESQVVRR